MNHVWEPVLAQPLEDLEHTHVISGVKDPGSGGGEQGSPGLALWLTLQLSGLWQMEWLLRDLRRRACEAGAGADRQWQAPLATALQHAQLVCLLGSVFVGIADQPFVLMLIALQCGLWSYFRRIAPPARTPLRAAQPPRNPAPLSLATPARVARAAPLVHNRTRRCRARGTRRDR
ncbi:MAG: hypothetical protein V4579_00455 [Pseudomonadota bacterium]